ncbi:copper chaperone PCu(A)C [Caulobacter sp. LjRoot300]|uniref:copper chaperone PCu(A)C n=1 Tax=Caulobacter sp. LjRoot300 TaxID=3342321 RepID=UPI003ECEF820
MKPFLAALALAAVAMPSFAAARPPAIQVTDAWCRAAPKGALAGGCYVTLTAGADDRLVAVDTPAAARAEIHTMSMDGGVMRMRKLADGVALPAGKPVALKPGAEHLMLIGPKIALTPGAKVVLTLRFKSAPPVTVTAPVKAVQMPAMSMPMGGH